MYFCLCILVSLIPGIIGKYDHLKDFKYLKRDTKTQIENPQSNDFEFVKANDDDDLEFHLNVNKLSKLLPKTNVRTISKRSLSGTVQFARRLPNNARNNHSDSDYQSILDLKESINDGLNPKYKKYLNKTKKYTNLTLKKEDTQNINTYLNNLYKRYVNKENNEVEKKENIVSSVTSPNPMKSLTTVNVCKAIQDRICDDIKFLNILQCRYDNIQVSINQLCDGRSDCPDGTDEKNCNLTVTNKIRQAQALISEIETPSVNNCFKRSTQDFVWEQILLLENVLVEYVDVSTRIKKDTKKAKVEIQRKPSDNNMALVMSAFSLSLHGKLCMLDRESQFFDMKFNAIDEETNDLFKDAMLQQKPSSCECKEFACQFCSNACKLYCWRLSSLVTWGCDSVNGTGSVSLNSLCDDVFDCYDKSDEDDCYIKTSNSKYIISKLKFKEIIDMIKQKANSTRSPVVRNELISLNNKILELRNECTKTLIDSEKIINIRNECFSKLGSIYENTAIEYKSFEAIVEEMYEFLLNINRELVISLKNSNIGNRKAPKVNCQCENGLCTSFNCTRRCKKACTIQIKLTRHSCKKVSNVSISLDKICNGNKDCPYGDDESRCAADICRHHHSIILRNSLNHVGKNQQQIVPNELLAMWKKKAISKLKIAENGYDGKMDPHDFKAVLKEILQDLILAYGSVEDSKRSNIKFAFKHFSKYAKIIIHALRTCKS